MNPRTRRNSGTWRSTARADYTLVGKNAPEGLDTAPIARIAGIAGPSHARRVLARRAMLRSADELGTGFGSSFG